MPLMTAKEILDENNFFIGTIPWYFTFYIKPKTTTKKSTQSMRRQTSSGQSHSIPVQSTSATKLTLVLKSMKFQKTRLKLCRRNQG